MKLTMSCQTCGKILSVVEKDQITQDDITSYESSSFCDTVQSSGVNDNGDLVITYDGQTNIQATMTVE